ncbi:MAG: MFS transporter [Acidobacteriia bacterium]|nr:MFS transporter [Terriglobia bacterium]
MTARYKWSVVAMLWWIAFFNYADRQAIFSVFPLLERELRLSTVQLGLLGSSFAWVYGIFSPIAGTIVDRVRRKSAILGGLHLWSAICMATAASRGFGALLFFRAAEGLGESFYFPAGVSMVSAYHGGSTRSRALGLHQTSVYIGTIGGASVAGWIAQHYGWRAPFVIFGAAGVVLGLVLSRLLVEPPRATATARVPVATFLRTLKPAAILLMLAFLCANFVAVVLLSWMPKFLYDEFHLSLAASGLTATIFTQLASMAGSPIGGWLADVLHRRTPAGRAIVQAIGVFGGTSFVVLTGLTRSIPVLIAALAAWGFFKGLYDANIFAAIFDAVPEEARGTAAGLMNMTGWIGGGAAPLIVGIVATRTGLGAAIAMTAGLYVVAGVLLVAASFQFAAKKHE